jgi:rhodanese-related sulfurtransferase
VNNIFQNCKLQIDGIPYVLPSEVSTLLQQGAMIVDLREELETEIKAFGIDKVVYLQHFEFDEKWDTLPLDKPLILADSVGLWSKNASVFLQSRGYSQVASLAGGFTEWERDGYPVKAGKFAPLNGPCLCMIKPHERK